MPVVSANMFIFSMCSVALVLFGEGFFFDQQREPERRRVVRRGRADRTERIVMPAALHPPVDAG